MMMIFFASTWESLITGTNNVSNKVAVAEVLWVNGYCFEVR